MLQYAKFDRLKGENIMTTIPQTPGQATEPANKFTPDAQERMTRLRTMAAEFPDEADPKPLTPTSIYLANRGVKTANVPRVPNMRVPIQLERIAKPLVVGLTASPERIVQIRQNRLLGLNAHRDDD